jgi:general secretion pathway protein D
MMLNKKHNLANIRHLIIASVFLLASGFVASSYAADTAQINLKNADIKTLIDMVSRITKKTFIVDPRINGKVTIITGRDIDENELYEVFLSVLQVHNFSAVKVGKIIKIVPSNKAKQLPVPVIDGKEEKMDEKQPDDLVTRVIRVEHVPASMLVPILRPLVPSTGQLQAYSPSNTIVISDTAANIRRLVKVIKNMDRADDEQMEVVPLKYASAKELAATIQKLNNTNAKTRVPGKAKISADERTNSLLLGGDKSIRGEMRKIIARLDTPSKALEVVELKYAVAEELAQTIRDIQKTRASGQKGVVVARQPILSIDRRTNSLLLGGDTAMRHQIKGIIRQFDTPKRALEVVKLRYAVASALAKTILEIRKTTASAEGAKAKPPILSVDEGTNSLLIGGNPATREQIKRIIKRFDVPRVALEVIPLRYAVAKDLAQTIKNIQSTSSSAKGVVTRKPIISVDNRTNSLLLGGDSSTRQQIKRIIRQLDISKPPEEKTRVVYLRYAKAADLAKVLSGYAKTQKTTKAGAKGAAGTTKADIDIQADDSTNSLIITANKLIHKNLAKVIRRLDIRRAQVMVEVIIAEVSENLSKEIGVQLAVGSSNGTAPAFTTGYPGAKASLLSIAASKGTSLPSNVGIVAAIANTQGKFQFAALMNALKGDAATNILSTPNVVAMDNEEAEFVIGKNVPFVTGSYTSTGGSSSPSNPFQTIERRDVGLTLKIKPQVNEGNSVLLDIDQEISSLAASSEDAQDLITNKRSIKTKVTVEDNQILVLGGLMQDDYTTTKQKVPFLGDLPIIGKAFQNTRTTKVKQNLMIFIHPVILRDVLTATGYTREKYNKLRHAQQSSKITSRGILKHKATALPARLEGLTTQKMTPAQIKAMRLAEWKKMHPEQYQTIRQNVVTRRAHVAGEMTPTQLKAMRLEEWYRTHPQDRPKGQQYDKQVYQYQPAKRKAEKRVQQQEQPVRKQQTGLELIESF